VRKVISILLISLVLYIPICTLSIASWFSVYQDQIASTLCIKKDIKGNTCQGHCVLKNKMDLLQEDADDSSKIPNILENKNPVLFFELLCNIGFDTFASYFKTIKGYSINYSYLYSCTLLNPPDILR